MTSERRRLLRSTNVWMMGTVLAGALSTALADDLSIKFLAPPPNLPVSGETRVALEVAVPPATRLIRIDVYIDEQHVASLESAPFEILWDAGSEFRPHRFRAVASDSAGHTATASLDTPPLRIGQKEAVSLVSLYVNVFDGKGRSVTDLRREEFSITEDGSPQEISHFSAARQPLSVALLLDASNSMGIGNRMEVARRAAIDFMKRMDPADRLLVMSFSDTVREIQPLTRDRKRLEKAIQSISAEGGTALYDALVEAASRLKDYEGRKALVLLSDGRDQAFKENAPGSLHLFDEAVDSVVRSEVVVYAVGLGARLQDETDLSQRWTLRQILDTLSEKTGGRTYNPERAGQLSDVYQQISEDLSRQYTLAYSPTNEAQDGRWRTIRVQVDRPGLRIVTRPGYFARSH